MNREQIVQLYDQAYAADYDRKFLLDPLVKPDTEAELALLDDLLKTHRSWLDVACGTGFFLRHFPHVERAGIDLSPAMLDRARQGNDGVRFRAHDYRDPIPEWNDRWELVSCMWYAYGLVDTIRDMERLIENLWAWTSASGTCFVPLADPSLITGVNIPFKPPTHNDGEVIITGIIWSYVEDGGQKTHAHQLAPNLDFMVEQFGRYFTDVKLVRYPPRFPGWAGRPAILASRKKPRPDNGTR
ncbi:trans-aconitate 2-methyltransferase [Bradyrhizobium liaoningense]|uniref:class I SAM-dependent methyltransferase n=1 Tax=Bradyrhizobium liaoningense TaxID=43992 RepID=UPI001BA90F36|nr:class I SAM-dependent methyltransferase [Bradyrhizobium liaoningense]MBR0717747.1 class I SAM-dependent methyltransferase [Bradyrhizobium liaoningense]